MVHNDPFRVVTSDFIRPQVSTTMFIKRVPMCYAGLSLGGPLETQFEGSGITYLQRDSVAQLLG